MDGAFAFFGLKVIPVVILGGLDSILGAIVGGLVMGILENLAGGYLDPIFGGGVKEVAPFIALVAILSSSPTASSARSRSSASERARENSMNCGEFRETYREDMAIFETSFARGLLALFLVALCFAPAFLAASSGWTC